MMLARIIQFLIGAAFGAGGGYLAWMHRAELTQLFPPGPEGLPVMLIAGIGALSLGLVFLVSAVAPRPKRTARLQAAAARRAETLRAADTYYAERSRAADRDWRSGKLPPHTPAASPSADPLFDTEPAQPREPEGKPDPLFASAPARTPEPEPRPAPLFDPAPTRMAEPAPKLDPLFEPEPTPEAESEAKADPLFDPAPHVVHPEPGPEPIVSEVAPRAAQEAATRSSAAKPVATSVPPTPMAFPSTATLAPIPKSSDPPPQPIASLSSAQAESSASVQVVSPAAAPPSADRSERETDAPFADIRAALAAGRLEEADRLLNASRETATGLALAELTGLAGDHAAAAGRQSNAKWLWRLALKRFGEAGALGSPAARQVSERLRLADQ